MLTAGRDDPDAEGSCRCGWRRESRPYHADESRSSPGSLAVAEREEQFVPNAAGRV